MAESLEGLYFLYAEHCDGPFYMGWWLYAAPVEAGMPIKDDAIWIDYYWRANAIRRDLLGLEPDYSNGRGPAYNTAKEFVSRFPDGLFVEIANDGRDFTPVAENGETRR